MRTWLSGHLSTLVMIPVVLLILVGIIDTYRAFSTLNDASYTIKLDNLVNHTSSVVHEMQKERGMSAGFISSNGTNFSSTLPGQRQALDQQISALKIFLADNSFDDETQGELDTLVGRLNQLSSIRQRVTSISIPLPEMLGYYTENNRIMIELSTVLAHHVSSRKASQQFETLYNVASIKENAGIERAVLSSIFGSGEATPALYKRLLSLIVKQDTFFHTGELLADKEYLATLQKLRSSPEEKKVIEYRLAADNPDQIRQTSAEDWFSAATKRINILREAEITLISQIKAYATDAYSTSSFIITLEFVLLIVTLFLTYVILHTLAIRGDQTTEIDRVTTLIVDERDLTTPVEVMSHGELGNIANDINNTMDKLSADLKMFQASASEVVDASQNTSVIVEQTTTNVSSMRDHISQLMQTFNTLNSDITGDILKISEAENMSKQVTQGAKEGAQSVSSAVTQINDMANEVNSVGSVIKLLNERVNDILGMVDVIRAVAEQTNLLALNAAIEAARAGEQGRGFAVVADEVRSLASRTQESTEEIARVVDELMNSSNNAITAIEVGSEKASEAVDSVNSIDTVLSQVATNMVELDSLTSDIANSAQKQMQQLTQLSASVLEIDNMADENARGGEEIASATVQVFNLSAEMMAKVESYKTSTEELVTYSESSAVNGAANDANADKKSSANDDNSIANF